MAEKLYYVQDNRQVVGNCIMWWAKNRAGYTCELDKAQTFTEEEIQEFLPPRGRGTDVPWPKEVVDASVVRHCRMEPLRRWREKEENND